MSLQISISGVIDNADGLQPFALKVREGGYLALAQPGALTVPIPITALAVGDRVYCSSGDGRGIGSISGSVVNDQQLGIVVVLFRSGVGQGQQEMARIPPGQALQFHAFLSNTHDDLLFLMQA